MAKEEGDDLLPDKDAAKGFYAKYEPKEILGRWNFHTFRFLLGYIVIKSRLRIAEVRHSQIIISISRASPAIRPTDDEYEFGLDSRHHKVDGDIT